MKEEEKKEKENWAHEAILASFLIVLAMVVAVGFIGCYTAEEDYVSLISAVGTCFSAIMVGALTWVMIKLQKEFSDTQKNQTDKQIEQSELLYKLSLNQLAKDSLSAIFKEFAEAKYYRAKLSNIGTGKQSAWDTDAVNKAKDEANAFLDHSIDRLISAINSRLSKDHEALKAALSYKENRRGNKEDSHWENLRCAINNIAAEDFIL